MFSPIGAFFTKLFPSRVRGSGQGFSYNFGRALGAVFPTLVGYLSMSLGREIAVFAACAYAIMIVAVALLPETRGKQLRAYD